MRDGGLPHFTASEYTSRHRAVDRLAERERLRGLLLFGTAGGDLGVQYLSGWPATREAWLVYQPGAEPTLFVQFYNHQPNAARLAVVDDVRWGGPSSATTLANHLRLLGLTSGRVGLVGAIAYQHYAVLAAALPELTLVDVTPAFVELRLLKSDEELGWIRRAAELSDAAIAALAQQARPGLSEVELGAIVDQAYQPAGGQNTIHFFGLTSMANPTICVPAQRPTDRQVQPGDVLFVELGAQLWGYSGQVLRTFAIAAEPPPLYRQLHQVAEAAFDRVCAVLRDGATAEQVVEAAAVIEAAGFTIYDDLVHGSNGGYLPPILRSRDALHAPVPSFTFRAGMTVVVQPNVITLDQRAGVQVGEMVRVTASGVERLHQAPRGFLRRG